MRKRKKKLFGIDSIKFSDRGGFNRSRIGHLSRPIFRRPLVRKLTHSRFSEENFFDAATFFFFIFVFGAWFFLVLGLSRIAPDIDDSVWRSRTKGLIRSLWYFYLSTGQAVQMAVVAAHSWLRLSGGICQHRRGLKLIFYFRCDADRERIHAKKRRFPAKEFNWIVLILRNQLAFQGEIGMGWTRMILKKKYS